MNNEDCECQGHRFKVILLDSPWQRLGAVPGMPLPEIFEHLFRQPLLLPCAPRPAARQLDQRTMLH